MLTPQQARNIASDVFGEGGAILDEPERATAPAANDAASMPQRIGEYRICRVIATGGMGTVYEAEQEHPHRKVAVKVLKRDLVSRTALRRFQYETEILARLHHPGIAPIYEAGTHDDGGGAVPYFVMEYIENAQSITQYCDECGFDLRRRLELFLQVCDAVNHGHQCRIIHRDLKPANILIGEDELARVIDFGIACATDADVTLTTLHTDSRTLIGTLQYMSPEQATGGATESAARGVLAAGGTAAEAQPHDRAAASSRPFSTLDTRSDVYSLGVILYELVCGRLPYDLSGKSITQATRLIEEAEPPRPTVVCSQFRIRRDLEAVILKAMAKDRRRRYQTAAALADDLRRYLRGEAVEAKAPSRWMQTIRWVGKHPKSTVAAICIGSAAIAAVFTLVALAILDRSMPLQFDLTKPDRTALLHSVTGRVIGVVGGGMDSWVRFAVTAHRPDQYGGGRVALFSCTGTSGVNLTHGQLFLTDLFDFTRVYWQTESGGSYIQTPAPVGSAHDVYDAIGLLTADIFDDADHPGDEIVVIHLSEGHPGSTCAVRIYDWAGTTLFEAWHMGPIKFVAWLSEPKLLVCSADRHAIDWRKADAWGRANQSQYPVMRQQGDYPSVIFALRPALHKRVAWLTDRSDSDAQSVLAWYRCIRPFLYRSTGNDTTERSKFIFNLQNMMAMDTMTIDLTVDNPHVAHLAVGMQVGPDGVLQTRNPSDGYRRAEAKGEAPLPSNAFTIGDFPHEIAETLEETRLRWERDRAAGAR